MDNECLINQKVAIIGMAGKFPRSDNLKIFWDNLMNKKEGIQFFTRDELIEAGVDPEIIDNPHYVPASGRLNDIELFDAAFFQYTPREAEIIDPQQRLFLECAWNALEDSGYCISGYDGAVGVFAGVGANKYIANIVGHPEILGILDHRQIETGNDKDYLTTRVSYKLNLTGPSITVQTACSSSLVSVHLACQSLLNGECDLALAGGVSIQFLDKQGYMFKSGGIESPDGHCRCFDEKSEGTVFGDGVGVIVLKRLNEAIRDRDQIYAVISGSAVNNDGGGKVGYTAPGIDGQIQVITEAIEIAGVTPDDIGYIEAHGTGTKLGDKVEISALKEVLKERDSANKCYIGSVKANVGHLNTASGIVGLMKTALIVKNGIIPPQLNFNSPNPQLELENSPFLINKTPVEWENINRKRIAGVSSFGIGGTNAHVVLEEPPVVSPIKSEKEWQLLTVSGKTATALQKNYENLVDFIKANPDVELSNIAYTLHVGREHFPYRGYMVCKDTPDKGEIFEYSMIRMGKASPYSDKSLVFLFYSQGMKYLNMAKELYDCEPVVKETMDRCFKIVMDISKVDLKQMLCTGQTGTEHASMVINHETYVPALIFTVQYALAKLWIHWGFSPMAMSGDCIGEYVCACLAKVFSLDDAIKLIILQKDFEDGIKLYKPSIKFISNRTNTWIDEKQALSVEYWKDLMKSNGQFRLCSRALFDLKDPFCLGIGPKNAIKKLLEDNDDIRTVTLIPSLPGTEDAEPVYKVILNSLGSLWIEGFDVDWQNFYGHKIPGRVSLPTYAFDKQRYWIENYGTVNPKADINVSDGQRNDFCWIIVKGDDRADALMSKLRQRGDKYVMVRQAERFIRHEDTSYSLDLKEPGQVERLISELISGENSSNDVPSQETESIASKLCGVLEELLGISPIGINDNFIELGGDSVTAIQFASRVKQFNIDISHEQILEYPTIGQLLETVLPKNGTGISAETATQDSTDMKFHYIEKEDREKLEQILDLSKVEDVYPLSFMQLLVLNHNILNAHLGSVNIISFVIDEEIDKENFKAAWQKIIDRHPILRTGFIWRKISSPVQFVLKNVELFINELDWSGCSDDIRLKNYDELILSEKKKFFKTDEVPKMKLYLIKLGDKCYRFIWCYQNSLFDGWSMNIILKEFRDNYYRDITDQQRQVAPNPSYLSYIKWLKSQNTDEAKKFWVRELDGFTPDDLQSITDIDANYEGAFSQVVISRDEVNNLKEYSKKSLLTLNTIFVGAWAIVSSYMLNRNEFLLGIISSGRIPDIEGMENMIGLFTNSLPVRISYNGSGLVKDWLEELQKKLLNIRKFDYVTLLQISQWCKIPFDYLQAVINQRTLVYSNFPSDTRFLENDGEARVVLSDSINQLHLPLRIFAIPGEEFSLRIEYNKKKFDNEFISGLLNRLKLIIAHLPGIKSFEELEALFQ